MRSTGSREWVRLGTVTAVVLVIATAASWLGRWLERDVGVELRTTSGAHATSTHWRARWGQPCTTSFPRRVAPLVQPEAAMLRSSNCCSGHWWRSRPGSLYPAADRRPRRRGSSLTRMRAVQITRFGGPEVLDVVDLPDPVPGEGQQLFDVSTAGVNYADTHHRLSAN